MKSTTYAGLLALALGTVAAELSPCPATPPVCSVTISNGPNHHLKCMKQGVLRRPSNEGAQPIAACGAITEADCRNSCLYTVRCSSYGFDEATKVCTMSTSTLRMQQFQHRLSDTTYSSADCYTPNVLDHPGDDAFTSLGGEMGFGRGFRTKLTTLTGELIAPTDRVDFPEIGPDSACDAIERCAAIVGSTEHATMNIHWSMHKGLFVCKYWRGLTMPAVPVLEANMDAGQYWNYESIV